MPLHDRLRSRSARAVNLPETERDYVEEDSDAVAPQL